MNLVFFNAAGPCHEHHSDHCLGRYSAMITYVSIWELFANQPVMTFESWEHVGPQTCLTTSPSHIVLLNLCFKLHSPSTYIHTKTEAQPFYLHSADRNSLLSLPLSISYYFWENDRKCNRKWSRFVFCACVVCFCRLPLWFVSWGLLRLCQRLLSWTETGYECVTSKLKKKGDTTSHKVMPVSVWTVTQCECVF